MNNIRRERLKGFPGLNPLQSIRIVMVDYKTNGEGTEKLNTVEKLSSLIYTVKALRLLD